mmetsp:Transcript_73275/g.174605  ORF Transcript_73275/g.174605 Transcript_73275/m.174605 type:complete len:282 (+) Transcript_73275:569-1414(+)
MDGVRGCDFLCMVVHSHVVAPECLLLLQLVLRINATVLGFRQVLGLHLLLNVPSLRNETVEVEIIHCFEASRWALEGRCDGRRLWGEELLSDSLQAVGGILRSSQGWTHRSLGDGKVFLHRLAPLVRAAVEHAQVAVVSREVFHGEDLALAAALDVASARGGVLEGKLELVRVLLVACCSLECKLGRTLLLLRVGAVVVRVMPCAGADAGHTCLHLGHDLQASGIRGHGDLAAGMDEGCRARTAVGHHSRGKGKSRDDLARHGTRGNKHYFRDTGLLRPGA